MAMNKEQPSKRAKRSMRASDMQSTLTLESIVAQITPDNQHQEQDWGEPAGNEVW